MHAAILPRIICTPPRSQLRAGWVAAGCIPQQSCTFRACVEERIGRALRCLDRQRPCLRKALLRSAGVLQLAKQSLPPACSRRPDLANTSACSLRGLSARLPCRCLPHGVAPGKHLSLASFSKLPGGYTMGSCTSWNQGCCRAASAEMRFFGSYSSMLSSRLSPTASRFGASCMHTAMSNTMTACCIAAEADASQAAWLSKRRGLAAPL